MKKYFLLLFALSLILVVIVFNKEVEASKSEEDKSKTVKIQEVREGEILEEIEFSNFTEYQKEVELSPEISGRLLSILKKEGEAVKKGELLAIIDADEVLAQAVLDTEQINSLRNNLVKTKGHQDQLVDESRVAVEKAENLYSIAKRGSDKDEERIAKRNKELAQEALKSAKELRDLQSSLAQGQIGVLQKQKLMNSVQIENTKIKAPFNGVLTRNYKNEGELVSPMTKLFMLVGLDQKVQIEMQIPVEFTKNLEIGQLLKARNKKGIVFDVKIVSISPLFDTRTRKSNLKLETEGSNSSVGDFLSVFIPVKLSGKTLMISKESLKKDFHEDIVFVVKDGVSEKRLVEIGTIGEEFVGIKNGLRNGEMVVVEGQYGLRNGDKVKIYE